MISIAKLVFVVRLTSGLRSGGCGGFGGGGRGAGVRAGLGAPAELEARRLGGARGRGGGGGAGGGGAGLRGGGGRGGRVLGGGQQLGGAHVVALGAGLFILRSGGDLVLEVFPGEDGVQLQRHLVHGGHGGELGGLPV